MGINYDRVSDEKYLDQYIMTIDSFNVCTHVH